MSYDNVSGDPRDFLVQVGFTLIRGYTRVTALGNNPLITAAASLALPQDTWTGGGAYPWMAAGTALEVVSSDANDTTGGTGARTITVTALDTSYNAIATVTSSLNGVTPVQLPGGAQYFRIQTSAIATVGSNKTNVGTITIRDTGAGATRCIIPAGYGVARQSIYTVPAGFSLQIVSQVFSIVKPTNSTDVTVAVYTQTPITGANPAGLYRMPLELAPSNAPYRHDGIPGVTLAEKTDFAHRVVEASGTLTFNAGFLAVLRDNRVS